MNIEVFLRALNYAFQIGWAPHHVRRSDTDGDLALAMAWSTTETYADLEVFDDGEILCNARHRGDKPEIWYVSAEEIDAGIDKMRKIIMSDRSGDD